MAGKHQSFSNLGDHPGHTEHSPHGGMKLSVSGHRAHAGGGRIHFKNGGNDHEEPHEEEEDRENCADGGRIRLQRGGRGRGRRGEGTDSSISDTGARNRPTNRGNWFNAIGSPEQMAANDTTPSFGRGGAGPAKRKAGGTAGGMTATARMDHARRQRGGSARAPARTPYSTGSSLSPPADDREGRGYQGVKPA